LHQLTHFVLDEADRMLDMGFVHDVKKIIRLLPEKRQSLFFSATMPDNILALASSILSNPVSVKVDPVSSTADTVDQGIYFVNKDDKNQLLLHILHERPHKSVLVFTRTKHGADKVVKFLTKHRIESAAIHGNKSQNARQKALSSFKSGEISVLIATDIAARGIDIDELAFVINYEIPNIPETYVHRIGRTGRAGNSGKAFSFCDAEERAFVRDIEKLIAKKIPVVNVPFTIEKSMDLPESPGRSDGQTPQPTRQEVAGKTYFRGHASGGNPGRNQGGKAPDGKKKWFKKPMKQNQ
jgi:ATP-dependent RNA helicase RhlE